MSNADLRGTYFGDASLSITNLKGAKLSTASLRDARYLTVEQVTQAESWREADLDDGLRQKCETLVKQRSENRKRPESP